MIRQLIIAVVAVCAALAGLTGTQADHSKQKPIEVSVQFGTKSGDLVITPSELKFQRGQLYKLIINNSSNVTHYLSVPRFGAAVWTVGVRGGELNRTRSQNPKRPTLARPADTFLYQVQEIKVRRGGTAAWTLMPIQAGSYPFGCGISAHAEAGMVGNIVVN